MKILILGATGAAGTRLTAETLRRGHAVTAASRSTRRAGRRLVVVGGAAPLRIPGTSWSALEDPVWVPRRFRAFAASSSRQHESPTTSRGILSIGR